MTVTDVSASTQDYLKVIWTLQEWSARPVTASLVAEGVGVKLSTVSDAMRKLGEQGYVNHTPYAAITLTEAGRMLALAMVRRHRLIESFLVRTLGYGWDEVHEEAESLEHAVSDLMIERIDVLLGRPSRDPHGDPIPAADGSIQRPDAVQLSGAPAGARVRVERISDDDPQRLQYFATQGIVLDAVLVVAEPEPYSDTVGVLVAGGTEPVRLGAAAAAAVWVSTPRVD